MSTADRLPAGPDPQELADQEAVLRHALQGEPLEPEVRRRVHERAARVTGEISRTRGLVDDETFQKLLDDDES